MSKLQEINHRFNYNFEAQKTIFMHFLCHKSKIKDHAHLSSSPVTEALYLYEIFNTALDHTK